MRPEETRFLVEHEIWAPERLLAAAGQLSAAAFAAVAGAGHVAPPEVMLHSVSGLRTWRERMQRASPSATATAAEYPTFAAVAALRRPEQAGTPA